MPQWWQTIAKHAMRRSFPAGSRASTKPQSIWYASPGSVAKRMPVPLDGAALLAGGARCDLAAMYSFTLAGPPG